MFFSDDYVTLSTSQHQSLLSLLGALTIHAVLGVVICLVLQCRLPFKNEAGHYLEYVSEKVKRNAKIPYIFAFYSVGMFANGTGPGDARDGSSTGYPMPGCSVWMVCLLVTGLYYYLLKTSCHLRTRSEYTMAFSVFHTLLFCSWMVETYYSVVKYISDNEIRVSFSSSVYR